MSKVRINYGPWLDEDTDPAVKRRKRFYLKWIKFFQQLCPNKTERFYHKKAEDFSWRELDHVLSKENAHMLIIRICYERVKREGKEWNRSELEYVITDEHFYDLDADLFIKPKCIDKAISRLRKTGYKIEKLRE